MGAFGGGGEEPKKEAEAETVKPAFFYNLPEMVVNLNSVGGRAEFLKVSIALELAKKNDIDKLKPVEPRIMDVFQVYLRELRRDDLTGSAGLYRLKSELLKRVNIATYPQKISAVLFKEIIVQ
jgi:flagellar FliL protein